MIVPCRYSVVAIEDADQGREEERDPARRRDVAAEIRRKHGIVQRGVDRRDRLRSRRSRAPRAGSRARSGEPSRPSGAPLRPGALRGFLLGRQIEERLLERRALGDELVQDDALGGGDLAHLSGRRLRDRQQVALGRGDLDASLLRARREAGRPAGSARGCRRRRAPRARPCVACTTNLPRWMITTSSTICSTSARTWLEMKIVRPSAARERRSSRSQRIPCGSSPFAGSSSTRTRGIAEQRAREAEALAHAERVAAGAAPGRLLEVDEPREPLRPASAGFPLRQPARAGGSVRSGRDGSRTPRARRRPAASAISSWR